MLLQGYLRLYLKYYKLLRVIFKFFIFLKIISFTIYSSYRFYYENRMDTNYTNETTINMERNKKQKEDYKNERGKT